ncbi:DegV family protein [Dialister sp.]|uniref:DegV family protein n=1 Tax=Dialister sp. TaxID=1955814 RepID=UPI002E81E9B0|nr:DegV family protein [Dialister sp.]MEE3452073.1 DegV family protein [Dialister sp.]
MIHLVVDSTAAIPKDFLDTHKNVRIIPLFISMNGEYVPEYEATIEQVIDYSERTQKAIQTSQPSTGDFIRIFNEIPPEDPIIVICLTSGVSGTYNGAVLAARQSGRKNISVINSRTTAIGMMQIVEDGIEMIEQGLPFEEISTKLLEAADHMRTTFTVDTLDYLRRGGRIGKAAGLIGSILKIKPVIYLNGKNEVDVLAKVRTGKKAAAAMIDYLHENSPCKRIGIVHIENEEGGRALQSRVQAEYPDIEVTLSTGTAVLASYLGPGLTGIIFESAK